MPTQRSMELELFEIKETAVNHSDGHITINKTPKVTGKGQVYFINKFKEAAEKMATPEYQKAVEHMKLVRKQSTDEFIGMMKDSGQTFTPYRQEAKERKGFLRQSVSESTQQ